MRGHWIRRMPWGDGAKMWRTAFWKGKAMLLWRATGGAAGA